MKRVYITFNNSQVQLDLSRQILSIDLDDSTVDYNIRDYDDNVINRESVKLGDGVIEVYNIKKDVVFEGKLVPTLQGYSGDIEFASLSLFSLKAK